MNLIGYTFEDIYNLVRQAIPGGKQKAKQLFSRLYKEGSWEIGDGNIFELPPVSLSVEEGGTVKFLLKLEDGLETESIILPMAGRYNTLCVSSQVGCRWGCAFCETGKMGILRNLTKAEILAQFMTAELVYKKPIRNIVFMGMGEALDNFDNVMGAIDIFTHPWAMNMPKKSICISTVGNVEGIDRLTELSERKPEQHYHKLHLAVSLNGADDELRNKLMPVNRRWPLDQLQEALKRTRQYGKKDLLYFEYILIKGETDGEENARKLITIAKEFPGITINLIPFNPGRNSSFEKTEPTERERFHAQLLEGGIRAFTRISQGERIMAACGQLGNREAENPDNM
jgi:23S rRNA (adenine2503-C2)-methyltransferase